MLPIAVASTGPAVTLFFVIPKDKSYRLLKLFEFSGSGTVTRENKGAITPYANMVLENGDMVKLDTGVMTIQADDDKFIHLDQHTTIKLSATGTSDKSKTSIELLEGGITSDIRNKLSAESTYEVNTPNSAMSVRGTVFYTTVYEIDGVKYTKTCCFEGEVVSRLVYKNGTYSVEEVPVIKGKEVIIYDDGTTRDYLYDEPQDIDYSTLPREVLEDLKDITDINGDNLSISNEELTRLLEGPFYVTFTYKGQEFGTQIVNNGEYAQIPALSPSDKGNWDYDFKKPIDRDTTIEWKG